MLQRAMLCRHQLRIRTEGGNRKICKPFSSNVEMENTDVRIYLQKSRSFIIERGTAESSTSPKSVHVNLLSRFVSQFPESKRLRPRDAIRSDPAGGVKWVVRGRGKTFVEVTEIEAAANDTMAGTVCTAPTSTSAGDHPRVDGSNVLVEDVRSYLQKLRAFIIENGTAADTSLPKSIKVVKLRAFYATLSPAARMPAKAVIRSHPTAGVKWVVLGKGRTYLEATCIDNETASNPAPNTSDDIDRVLPSDLVTSKTSVDSTPALVQASIDDVLFPKPPSREQVEAGLKSLHAFVKKRSGHLDPVRMAATELPIFYDKYGAGNTVQFRSCVNRATIEAYGFVLGIRWIQTRRRGFIELFDPAAVRSDFGPRHTIRALSSYLRNALLSEVSVVDLEDFYVTGQLMRVNKDMVDIYGADFGIQLLVRNDRAMIVLREITTDATDSASDNTDAEQSVITTPGDLDVVTEASRTPALPDNTLYMSFDENAKLITSMYPFPHAQIKSDQSFDVVSANELAVLLDVLPADIGQVLKSYPEYHSLIEIVLDVGRPPLLRSLRSCARDTTTVRSVDTTALPVKEITRSDLESICGHPNMGTFNSGNRAGLGRTLHRISRKLNRQSEVIGLTMRIGRMIKGATLMISDIVASKKSVLLIGMPGVGKTSVLREYSRLLAEAGARVEVVDTSNEICGDNDAPHDSVGRARRMMVKHRDDQHRVMIEAVQNHMPQCIVVDEIGTRVEATASSDIAQRGVQIIATAHSTHLEHLLRSPELDILLGGVHTVVVGDMEKLNKNMTNKSIRERKGRPVFDVVVELHTPHKWIVYNNVSDAVDAILSGKPPSYEIRTIDPATGHMMISKVSRKRIHVEKDFTKPQKRIEHYTKER